MRNINKEYSEYKKNFTHANIEKVNIDDVPISLEEKVCIIVPYRNNESNERVEQLNNFVKYYHNYLPNLTIVIAEQSNDGNKFNRGAVLNAGFKEAVKYKFDRYIFHDVDLISPSSIKQLYTWNPESPVHIANLWKEKYNFSRYFGGIVSFSQKDYMKINGYPNNSWGWGGEDDITYNRVVLNSMNIIRPISVDENDYIVEMKHKSVSNDPKYTNLNKKLNILNDLKNWKRNGVKQIKYTILECGNFEYENVIKITFKLN